MKWFLCAMALMPILAIAEIQAASILQTGAYQFVGDLDDLSSVQVEIRENSEFVATFVWYGHQVGPDGLDRYTAEVRGVITSPETGIVRFQAAATPLRWPLDQKFSIVSDSEIRTEQGYWHVQPGGRLVRPPSEITYLVMKKTVEPGARPNAAEPPPLSGTPPQA